MGSKTITIPTLFSKGAACTLAPLWLLDDEGDDEKNETVSIPTLYSMSVSVIIPTLSSKTNGPACTKSPLSLDDDEGDNEGMPKIVASVDVPTISSKPVAIPTLSSKVDISIPTLQSKVDISVPTISSKPAPEPTQSNTQKQPDNSKPLQMGGMWKTTMRQEIHSQSVSLIDWKLMDSNGKGSGGGIFSTGKGENPGRIKSNYKDVKEEDRLPFDISVKIFNEGKTDTSWLQFQLNAPLPLGCVVSWHTAGTKDNKPRMVIPWQLPCLYHGYGPQDFGCDDLYQGKWEEGSWNENTVVEDHPSYRDFTCWFRYLGRGIRTDSTRCGV
jgi:hypothetical protein